MASNRCSARSGNRTIADILQGTAAAEVIVLSGGMGRRRQAAAFGRLEEPSAKHRRIVLATGRFIGEGFDDPWLDTLFLATPISWRGTLQQYAGRLHREHADKHEVRIYDYVDADVPAFSGCSASDCVDTGRWAT